MTTDDKKIDRYELVAELGRGAMGVVYKAVDPLLDRTVAIKTVNMALDRDGVEQYEGRFRQEARAAGGLNHPNIVTIYDIGKAGDLAYMAMEFIDGVELRAYFDGGTPMGVPRAVSIAAQVAEGLAYAHERGVVHRDIKPANIMVPRSGPVKITDFGIARMRASEVYTQTGMMLGSPRYMSPEQVLGKRADHRSDLFSFGIIVYEMLTGKPPFGGESVNALMYQIVNLTPPAPSATNPAVPEMLDFVVAKMLAKPLEERYQSAADVARDLRECERLLQDAASQTTERAPGSTRFYLDSDAQSMVLNQTIERSRRSDEQAPVAEPSPAKGVARAFDSLEATQRLAVMTGLAEGPVENFVDTLAIEGAQRSAEPPRSWTGRDTAVVLGGAAAGLIAAVIIMFA